MEALESIFLQYLIASRRKVELIGCLRRLSALSWSISVLVEELVILDAKDILN